MRWIRASSSSSGMTNESASADQVVLLPALFGLLTAKFEDAAGLATMGQSKTANHADLVGRSSSMISEAEILARAIGAIACDRIV